MGFDQLWPLAFLVLVPPVILLYILRQQAKPYRFSSLLLWQEAFRNLEATKPWEKLRRNLLLILQIAALLLLIFAMMGPWITSRTAQGGQLVLVIDNSASMETLYEEETTRLEAARQTAIDLIDSVRPNTKIHVITVNRQAELTVSGTDDHLLAKQQIRSIKQSRLAGDPENALGLAASCAAQDADTRVIFLTDSAFSMDKLQGEIYSFWSETDNLALTGLSAAERDGEVLLLATVDNYGGSEVTQDINLFGIDEEGSESLLAIEKVTVAAGEQAVAMFSLPAETVEGCCAFHSLLQEKDALTADNDNYCSFPKKTGNRILLLSENNLFLEKAFLHLAQTQVYRTADPAAVKDGEYDLYIFDGMLPEQLPSSGSFLFLNCDAVEGLFAAEEKTEGVRLAFRSSELTRYLDDAKLGVNEAFCYELPVWAESFLQCGDRTAGFYGICDGHRIAAAGFDLHQTDFALTAEFPIWISDLADYLLQGSLIAESVYTIGDSLILYGSTAGEDLQILTPDGAKNSLPSKEAYGAYYLPAEIGIYHVEQRVEDRRISDLFAVRFPYGQESVVEPAVNTAAAKEGTGHLGTVPFRRLLLGLLLLLLLLEWIIYLRRVPRRTAVSRRIGEYILRGLVMFGVLLALFEPSVNRQNRLTTTVFVVDLSDSIAGNIDAEVAFVKASIAQLPEQEQAGIVVFGSDAAIEQFVTDKKSFTEIGSVVSGSATDIEQALTTAVALFPEESAKRIVLMTDGEENEGDMTLLLSTLQQKNIELKAVSYDNTIDHEVYVSSLSLPDRISQGEAFRVITEIYSSEATEAAVTLYSGRTLKEQRQVKLQKGMNRLVFSDTGVEQGIRSYRVTVEAAADTVSINNSYSAFTRVEEAPLVLLVEGSLGSGAEMEALLSAGGFACEKITPLAAPGSVSDLLRYSTVILDNVHTQDMRKGFPEALAVYVNDYAGGLICLGGDNSYALGNYQDTVLEDILPVSSHLQGEKEVPSIAMVMVIDHSGSMESPSVDNNSVTCLDVAKNAAENALTSLRDIDQVGVVAFDDRYSWAVPLQSCENRIPVVNGIRSIPAGGGTSIYPALAAAADALLESSAAIRHIVLLTDGQDGYRTYDPLLKQLNENNISLSTVAIGQGADSQMLGKFAEAGNGRYYYSDAGSSLPRIFAQEVYLSTKSYLINEEFVPVITNSHPVIEGIFAEGSPSLLGYVATTLRPGSIGILSSDREDPILAVRQVGLGRSVAWTSDGEGSWTRNFTDWDRYSSFWKNLIDWSITGTDPGTDLLTVSQEASSLLLSYETDQYDAATKITAVITDEKNEQRTVVLHAQTPGVYTAAYKDADPGIYSISLRNSGKEELVRSINTAACVQYSREYRFAEVSKRLDSFVAQAKGRLISSPEEVFDTKLIGSVSKTELTLLLLALAALLFMLDILCRRLSLDWAGALARTVFGGSGKVRQKKQKVSVEEKKQQTEQKVSVEEKKQQTEQKISAVKRKPQRKEPAPQAIDTAALLKKKKDRNL